MTVGDLIEQLRQFPEHMPVTVDGYEGGVTETFGVSIIYIEPDAGGAYEGEHRGIVLGPSDRIEEYVTRRAVVNITRSPDADYYATPAKISP